MSALIIIGGSGELGCKVVKAASAEDGTGWDGDIIATFHTNALSDSFPRVTWQSLDCSDHKAVRTLLASQLSVGAVAYCAVPKHGGAAGKGGESVRTGIVDDVINAAEAAAMLGARFVAISTDLVFDGKIGSGECYNEQSVTCPPNPYGKYKVEMEERLAGISGKIVIARTSLILTMDEDSMGKGVQFVVDCIQGKHGEIEIFTDEPRNMSFADDLGKAVVELAKPSCTHVGVIHMVSDEVTNRWELAKLLAKKLGLEHLLGKYAKNGLSQESGLNRPLNCSLSTKLKNSVLKTKIRGITERLG